MKQTNSNLISVYQGPDADNVYVVSFGQVEGLPAPEPGTLYVVSAFAVYEALLRLGSLVDTMFIGEVQMTTNQTGAQAIPGDRRTQRLSRLARLRSVGAPLTFPQAPR